MKEETIKTKRELMNEEHKEEEKEKIEKNNEEEDEEEEEKEKESESSDFFSDSDDKEDNEDNENEANNEKPQKAPLCGNFVFGFFIIITIATALINKFGPPEQHGQRKIMHPQQEMDKLLQDIDYYLQNPAGFFMSIQSAFMRLGQMLNNSKSSPYVLSSVSNNMFIDKLQKHMTQIASSCENPLNAYVIMFSYYFLHDYTATAGDVIVNKNVIKKVFANCYQNENATIALFSFLMMAAQTNNGRASMSGVGPYITDYAKSMPFGKWTIRPLYVYTLWTETSKLYSNDQKALCEFVEYIVDEREAWSADFKDIFCKLKPRLDKCEIMKKQEIIDSINFCADFNN